MKKFTKILILSVFTILMIGGFANSAFAEPLGVQFSSAPLFNVSNFMPGDDKSADITINNNSDALQNAYIEAVNVSNGDNLASQMNLKISESGDELYNNNFGTFLNAGPVPLSDIGINSSKTYNLKITFLEGTNNDYQGKSLGFDICVGFKGGNQTCTNTTVVGPEQPGGGGGGGGGGSSGSQLLIISNENASNISANGIIPESGQATITWNTNIPATSQVVWGLATGAPYTFNVNNLPAFGYPFVNTEDLTKKVNHEMLLTGLTPGATYVYRVVSRASPPTVSSEHQFTVPLLAQADNNIFTNNINTERQGEILGANTEDIIDGEEDGEVAGWSDRNLAAAIASGFPNILSNCYIIALIILLVLYLIWKLWLRKRFEKSGIQQFEIMNRFYLFFGVSSIVVVIVLLIFKQYCPLIIFAIIFIVSASIYSYRKLKIK